VTVSRGPGPRRRRDPPHLAEFLLIRRRLTQAVLALSLVTLIGVIGFAIIGRGTNSLIDAIYMTVITLTTVGYGEIIDLSSHPVGRLFTIALLLVGMGIVAYTVPMLAAFLIEGRLFNLFARRRMDRDIALMQGHFIVCGETPATWYVADELRRSGRALVVVAPTEAASAKAFETLGDIPRVVGDPSDDQVLVEAGVERAAGVVVCMAGDKDNVLVTLTARRLAPAARIVARTESGESEAKLRTVGADAVVSPSRIGGLRMASELVRPAVVSFLDEMLRDPRTSLRVEEIAVPPGSAAVGRSLDWLNIDGLDGAVLLALRTPDGKEIFKPPQDAALEPGAILIAMVDAGGRARIEERLRTGRKSTVHPAS
jgi:voltage-gated potassium channel